MRLRDVTTWLLGHADYFRLDSKNGSGLEVVVGMSFQGHIEFPMNPKPGPYPFVSNHSFSFPNANPRCDIPFFFCLFISPNVSPSTSKIGSHPFFVSQPTPLFQTHGRNMLTYRNLRVPAQAQSYPTKIFSHASIRYKGEVALLRLTKTLPSNKTGSCSGPSQYANVHTA